MDKHTIAARQIELQNGAMRLRDEIWHLKELLKEKENDLFATNGAIEDCAYWIQRIGMEEIQKQVDDALDEACNRELIKETSAKTMTDFVRMAQGDDETLDCGY